MAYWNSEKFWEYWIIGILENSNIRSRGNIGKLEHWILYGNIGILEYWNPREFQYSNILRGNIGKFKYWNAEKFQWKYWTLEYWNNPAKFRWNIGFLENSNIPILTVEILEFLYIGILENSTILESWEIPLFQYFQPGKFQYFF